MMRRGIAIVLNDCPKSIHPPSPASMKQLQFFSVIKIYKTIDIFEKMVYCLNIKNIKLDLLRILCAIGCCVVFVIVLRFRKTLYGCCGTTGKRTDFLVYKGGICIGEYCQP